MYHFQELSRSSIRDAILERDGRYVSLKKELRENVKQLSPAQQLNAFRKDDNYHDFSRQIPNKLFSCKHARKASRVLLHVAFHGMFTPSSSSQFGCLGCAKVFLSSNRIGNYTYKTVLTVRFFFVSNNDGLQPTSDAWSQQFQQEC